jgi:hypothetical protein
LCRRGACQAAENREDCANHVAALHEQKCYHRVGRRTSGSGNVSDAC